MRFQQLAQLLAAVLTDTAEIAGKKAFQKVLYFAQALGWDTGFSFDLQYSGPFSSEAAAVLELFAQMDVLRMAENGISAGPNLEKIAGDEKNPRLEHIAPILGKLMRLDSKELEHLATLHFILDTGTRAHLGRERLIDDVAEYEGEGFNRQRVDESLRQLTRLTLLPA